MFTTLHHLIDIEWLTEAYRRTRKGAAAGVDEVTAAQYAADLESNLESLYARYKEGTYVAPPVRRVWIDSVARKGGSYPEADGSAAAELQG